MFSLDFMRDNFTFILSALPVTLLITFLSLIFSTLLGGVFAWVMIGNVPYVKYLVQVFISFGRSIPMLVMLYFVFYVWPWIASGLWGGPQDTPFSYKLSPLVAAVTAFPWCLAPTLPRLFAPRGMPWKKGNARPHGR